MMPLAAIAQRRDYKFARTMNLQQSHHIYFQRYHGMQDDYPNLTCPGQLLAALQQHRRKQQFVTSMHHSVDQR